MPLFLSLTKRYWWLALLLAFLAVAGVLGKQHYMSTPSFKTSLFITVGINESKAVLPQADHLSTTEGADNFTETLMGWFRSPAFNDALQAEAKKNILPQEMKITKQEYQNVVVSFEGSTEGDTKILQSSMKNVLEKKLNTYNTNNGSAFTFTIEESKVTPEHTSIKLELLLALLSSIIIAYLLGYGRDLLGGKVSASEELTEIFGEAPLLSLTQANSKKLLSSYLAGAGQKIIIGETGKESTSVIKEVAKALSHIHHQNVMLIDANLKDRDLHAKLGLSERLEHVKGITDLQSIEKEKNFYVLEKGEIASLNYLPAGKGESIFTSCITSLEESIEKILLLTKLPENAEVLALTDTELLLTITLGKTRKEDLLLIRKIFPGKIVTVLN